MIKILSKEEFADRLSIIDPELFPDYYYVIDILAVQRIETERDEKLKNTIKPNTAVIIENGKIQAVAYFAIDIVGNTVTVWSLTVSNKKYFTELVEYFKKIADAMRSLTGNTSWVTTLFEPIDLKPTFLRAFTNAGFSTVELQAFPNKRFLAYQGQVRKFDIKRDKDNILNGSVIL